MHIKYISVGRSRASGDSKPAILYGSGKGHKKVA